MRVPSYVRIYWFQLQMPKRSTAIHSVAVMEQYTWVESVPGVAQHA